MLKLKHLRHPVRAARSVRDFIFGYRNMRQLLAEGEQRFKNDPRYSLQNVKDGFASRLEDPGHDAALLERICCAYIHGAEQERLAKPAYQPTAWWKTVRNTSLEPVRRALMAGDTKSLRVLYQNFYRDPCSAGLVGVPFGMLKAFQGKSAKEAYQRFFLSDVLHRIDYWKSQTGNRYELRDLANPNVGNPFGVQIGGDFVSIGAEYHHYCAHRIGSLLPPDGASLIEIGGGYGSMAYYLLRNRPALRYADFDVPESIALASYYLLKACPRLRFLLSGEEELTPESQNKFDVILMPLFELGRFPAKSADLAFSSHAMSNLSTQAMAVYLNEIVRTTRQFFLYVGDSAAGASFPKQMDMKYGSLTLLDERALKWSSMSFVRAKEVELLYRIDSTNAVLS